ncbi:hypothetical protein H0H92_000907 [Tricholoma furcatifolium]|nr:hypothetical protein H0H92_000907 [Tricholoma furcatifolium]
MSDLKTNGIDSTPQRRPSTSIVTEQIGVWRFSTTKQHKYDLRRTWNEAIAGLALFRRLALEVSAISHMMLFFFVLSKLWEGIESALLMHLSSHLLRILEVGLLRGNHDTFAISMAIISRLSCSALVSGLNWWTSHYSPLFKARVTQYYEVHLMRARLGMDLSAAQDPDSQMNINPSDAWEAFEAIVSFMGELLTSASQLTLIVHASRSSGGPLFALLCVAKPLIKVIFSEDVWSKMNLNHKDYQRMEALSELTADRYREDYITGNLGQHILEEYEKARQRVGNTCTDEWWEQIGRSKSPFLDVISSMADDLPMVYCAAVAIHNPSKLSLASIAVLQQSSQTLRWSLHSVLHQMRYFHRHVSKLKNIYAVTDKLSKTQVGKVPYPTEKSSADGMAFELRDIVFEYPGSKNKSPALKRVSLSIKPGQLVVIVGANGSGKSTIIKLLSRLYDPTSGTLLVDGAPARDYSPSDLRKTISSFTQDHNIYPLSLYENIAFGHAPRAKDVEAVRHAAELGGAKAFLDNFVDGFETILDPRNSVHPYNLPDDPEHPMKKELKALEKKIEISGGQKQRLVASRTFMHLNSGNVKFVAVDEPSSALDPEAELQIFNRLIASRAGKTMVFVTHRFGHLTKHADLIVCMKDGGVVESGSHEDLMKLHGEYAKLYQIQAQAFVDNAIGKLAEGSQYTVD